MVKCAALLVPLAALLAATAPAAAQSADTLISIKDGVYTAEQGVRGAATYDGACAGCHMPEYFSEGLLRSWTGARLDLLFELIRTTMPEDRPGGLDRREYADVLAYILQLNGFPPGSRELHGEPDSLRRILIEGRQ